MEHKLRAGIVGATGMVGQRFITLLADHPYFEITCLAASAKSAGRPYAEAVKGRWKLQEPMPACVAQMPVADAADIASLKAACDFVFCAVDMPKDEIRALETAYAQAELPVVSNNSAHRWTPDVPMVIPEINPEHLDVIAAQRKRLGTKKGFIAVKPNCSIQSYVPALTPLRAYGVQEVLVTTFQAISGAGKTFETFPEILDNVIPYIGGEEEKSEKEPLKIWGHIENGAIVSAETADHLRAVHTRAGVGWTSGDGGGEICEQARARGHPQGMGVVWRRAAKTGAAACARALHHLL